MKNKALLTLLLLIFSASAIIEAQLVSDELRLTMKEAQDYAIGNNKTIIASRMEVEASKAAIWETISGILPQIEASGSFTDNLKLMTTLLPGDFFGRPGEKVPVTFGSQFNSSATVQASLLLFNAPVFIGIETTKLARKLSEQSLAKTELDTKELVRSAYYLILVSERSLKILDENMANLRETLKSTQAMYSAGMAESTDVDQISSNLTMVDNSRSAMQRNIELNYNILRFQLGVAPGTRIVLSESLDALSSDINIQSLLGQEFDHKQNVNYLLVEGREQMSSLALKTQKAAVLPTLAGFYNYGTNGMGDQFSELSWFQNSMTGLQLTVPIFGGGQRYHRIKKAQINLEKARTVTEVMSDQLLLQEKQLRYNLVNANLQYQSQKNNVEVSKRVYASTENKFRQGMASSLELTQANSLYLQAENNYISALLNLLQTKLALDKLLNNI